MSRSAAASASPLTQNNVATTSDRMICRTLWPSAPATPIERLPQRGGVGFEHGPDAALGDQQLGSRHRRGARRRSAGRRAWQGPAERWRHSPARDVAPCVKRSPRPGATASRGRTTTASASSSSSVAASPRFSPCRSRKSRSGHAAMARIVPNRIAVAKGRSTARTPRSRPAKSRSRTARSRSCVVPITAGHAPRLPAAGIQFAIDHLLIARERGSRHDIGLHGSER